MCLLFIIEALYTLHTGSRNVINSVEIARKKSLWGKEAYTVVRVFYNNASMYVYYLSQQHRVRFIPLM